MQSSAPLALATLALCALTPHGARADAVRAVVRVAAPLDADVAQRIEGQTSDLDVQLERQEVRPGSLAEHAGEASARASEGAVVLWFARTASDAPRYLVYVTTREGTSLLARLPMAPPGSLASSALETAALVARAALQAIAHGEAVAALAPARDEDPREVPKVGERIATPPTEAPQQPVEPRDDPEGDHAASAVRLNVFAGAQQQFDGTGQLGRQGIHLRAGMQWGSLELGLMLAPSFANATRDQLAELLIARHDATATVAFVTASERWPVWIGAHSGVALFDRSTRPTNVRLQARSAQLSAAWLFGPSAGAALMSGVFGVSLHAALDVLPNRPELRYAAEDHSTRLAYAPPWLSPRIALGLQARLP
jgi:hypothetical protein